MTRLMYRFIGSIFLISGTTIGAGILALPVETSFAGFFPSAALFILCWLVMTYTAFLTLEATLWMPTETNLTSIVGKTLGRPGQIISWMVYLFLLYSLTTAYMAGCRDILVDLLPVDQMNQVSMGNQGLGGFSLYFLPEKGFDQWILIPVVLLFGSLVYFGIKSVDRFNRLFVILMIVAYALLVTLVAPHMDQALLRRHNWFVGTFSLPLLVTTFGFHIVIPSLVHYLKRDVAQLKKAILIGSIIPLIVYLVWEGSIIGVIPFEGVWSLKQAFIDGKAAVSPLAHVLNQGKGMFVGHLASFFAFFAIITSFLGVTLSLSDFLADGLTIKKTVVGKGIICLLTFFPPLIFTLTIPRAFFQALDYAGAFGVAILLILFPALMVWKGRYGKKIPSSYQVAGGKKILVVIILFALGVMSIKLGEIFGWFSRNL